MPHIIPSSVVGIGQRFTAQDACDVPLTTANRMLSDNAFMMISFEPDVEDGAEIVEYLADGSICIHDKDDPRLKGFMVKQKICSLNPLYIEMLTGGAALRDTAGDIYGGVIRDGLCSTVGGKRNSVQVEVWARNSNKDACDIAGNTGAAYARWIAPRVSAWKHTNAIEFSKGNAQHLEFEGYAQSNRLFVPALGLDPNVDENAPVAQQTDRPPAGTAFDPDLNFSAVEAFRDCGVLGWVGTNTLPAMTAAGSYAA